MMRWILNRLLKKSILKERKRQIKLGFSKDLDQSKGWLGLLVRSRQYHERGKYIEALALLEASTEVANRVHV